jgi:DNA-binding transcriptional MerR regulator/effector-binding domain-containing protein
MLSAVNRLPIGAFSRLTHLSVKTLRYYHEVGLLEPAVIDPTSGYRYYQTGQAETAQLVRRFRDLAMPIADIKAVLAAPDRAGRDRILAVHLDRLRQQLSQTEAAVDSLRRMLDGSLDLFRITERELSGALTLSIRADVTRAELGSWWHSATRRLRSVVDDAGIEMAGAAGGVYEDGLFTDDRGSARAYLLVQDTPRIHCSDLDDLRFELAAGRYAIAQYDGPHSEADRVYAALGTYAAKSGRDAAGPVREHYLTGPLDTPDQNEWRTEICWPLSPHRRIPTG